MLSLKSMESVAYLTLAVSGALLTLYFAVFEGHTGAWLPFGLCLLLAIYLGNDLRQSS